MPGGFGSGGREIASRLADELGIHSYENRILTLAAQYSGRDEQDFVEVDERLRGTYLTSQLRRLQKRLVPVPQKRHFPPTTGFSSFRPRLYGSW